MSTGKENRNARNEHADSPGHIPGARIISYNLNEGERPDGLKVRFKIRVETGKKARALDKRQAEAVKELLLWVRQHRQSQEP